MPLPCSPVSYSEASQTHSSDEQSDDSLTTPTPGPTDPGKRTEASLSKSLGTVSFDRYSLSPGSTRGKSSNIGGRDVDATDVGKNVRQPSISFSPQSAPPKAMADSSYAPPAAFSSSAPDQSPRGGPRRPISIDEVAESSADESTAIIRTAKSTSLRASNYGGTSSNGHEVTSEEPRQRKNDSTVKTKPGGRGTAARPNEEQEDEHHESWFKGLVEKYGSVELENKGSVARDHLALERTFLAWLRTSLSFASIGIAITQLFRLNTTVASNDPNRPMPASTTRLRSVGKPLGATFLGISILILLLGFHRYFESQHYVIRGKFPASRGTVLIVSAVAAALIITSLVVVIAVAPQAFET